MPKSSMRICKAVPDLHLRCIVLTSVKAVPLYLAAGLARMLYTEPHAAMAKFLTW